MYLQDNVAYEFVLTFPACLGRFICIVCCLVVFYGMSSLVGYLTLNPVNTHTHTHTHTHTYIYIYIYVLSIYGWLVGCVLSISTLEGYLMLNLVNTRTRAHTHTHIYIYIYIYIYDCFVRSLCFMAYQLL